MNWSPAQIGALENCGVKVEDATGDISFREFEFIDIIKPEPLKATKGFILPKKLNALTALNTFVTLLNALLKRLPKPIMLYPI